MRNWPLNIVKKNLRTKSSILLLGYHIKMAHYTKNSLALYLHSKLKKL